MELNMLLNEYKYISFNGAYFDGDNIYVSSLGFNGIVKINSATGKAEYICKFKEVCSNALSLHHKVYNYEGCLIFVPDSAKGIHVFNIHEAETTYLPIDKKDAKRTRCIGSILMDNQLWLFYAHVDHPVVIIDLNTFEMQYFYGILECLPQEILKRKNAVAFWSSFVQKGKRVFGVIWNSSYIVEIDTERKKVIIHELKGTRCRLSGIAYDGNCFWLIEAKDKVIMKWDSKRGVLAKYQVPNTYLENICVCCNIACCKGKVLVLFDDCNCVFYVNENKHCIEIFGEFPIGFSEFNDVRRKWRRFFSYDVVDSIVRFYPTNANMMLDINVEDLTVKGSQFAMDDKYDNNWFQCNIINPYIDEKVENNKVLETREITLEDYLKFIVSK